MMKLLYFCVRSAFEILNLAETRWGDRVIFNNVQSPVGHLMAEAAGRCGDNAWRIQ